MENYMNALRTNESPVAPFWPRAFLRSGGLQTLLSRVKPSRSAYGTIAQPFLIDAGPDICDSAVREAMPRAVKLLGYYAPHIPLSNSHLPQMSINRPRGLVLVLHGWEGCSHSNYNLLLSSALTKAGFDVVRLNLRDHGPNLHIDKYSLNPGIFLGILLEEVAHAVRTIGEAAHNRPYYLIGASMGGNFVLRLALQHGIYPIPNLRKVIAINPVMDPAEATDSVDRHPFLRRYFRRRWLDSLLTKQALYPHLYEFDELRNCSTIRLMTEQIIRRYGSRFGDFHNADDYFAQYAVAPTAMEDLTVATEIITAADDPIIAPTDFTMLPKHPLLSLQIHPTGGHVGYVDLFPLEHHLPRLVLRSLLA